MTTHSPLAEPSLNQWPTEPLCPYRGLDPFTENEAKYFFGRKEESYTLAANALTAPMTILYGPSGVGKSSLLMAGLVPELGKYSETIVVLFRTWREPDLIRAMNEQLTRSVSSAIAAEIDVSKGFDECANKVATLTRATVVVIFDQFEELFLYHPAGSATGDDFDVQFARVVNRRQGGFNFVISLREDWMAKLDRFECNIPNLLGNYIRLDHLDVDGAEMAIREPLTAWNAEARAAGRPEMLLDEALVPALIDEVKTGNVDIAGEGRGAYAGAVTHDDRARVETPFLQMILLRLWEAEDADASNTMRLETFRRLGGARKIVHAYVDGTMRALSGMQQETAASLFDRLVTPSGCKIALRSDDLQNFAGERAGEVPALLHTLAAKSILRAIGTRSEPRYEIFHDVLAQPILAWRTTYLTKISERKKIRRVLRTRLIAAAVIVVSLLGFAAWHFVGDWRAESRDVAHGQADKLLADARAEVERDPVKAASKLTTALDYYGFSKEEEGKLAVATVAASMIESARTLVKQEKYAEAIPFAKAAHHLSAVLHDSFISRRASRILALSASKTGRMPLFRRAMTQLDTEMKTVKHGPIMADALMRNGRLYMALQRPREALDQFNAALRECERTDLARQAEILYYRSAAQVAVHDTESAIASLQKALKESTPDLRLNILQSLENYSHELKHDVDVEQYHQEIAQLQSKRSQVGE